MYTPTTQINGRSQPSTQSKSWLSTSHNLGDFTMFKSKIYRKNIVNLISTIIANLYDDKNKCRDFIKMIKELPKEILINYYELLKIENEHMSMIRELLRDYDNFSIYLLVDIVNYFYYCAINITLFVLDLDLIECDMDNCLRILWKDLECDYLEARNTQDNLQIFLNMIFLLPPFKDSLIINCKRTNRLYLISFSDLYNNDYYQKNNPKNKESILMSIKKRNDLERKDSITDRSIIPIAHKIWMCLFVKKYNIDEEIYQVFTLNLSNWEGFNSILEEAINYKDRIYYEENLIMNKKTLHLNDQVIKYLWSIKGRYSYSLKYFDYDSKVEKIDYSTFPEGIHFIAYHQFHIFINILEPETKEEYDQQEKDLNRPQKLLEPELVYKKLLEVERAVINRNLESVKYHELPTKAELESKEREENYERIINAINGLNLDLTEAQKENLIKDILGKRN